MKIFSVTYIYKSNDLARSIYNVTDTVIASNAAEAKEIAVRFIHVRVSGQILMPRRLARLIRLKHIKLMDFAKYRMNV